MTFQITFRYSFSESPDVSNLQHQWSVLKSRCMECTSYWPATFRVSNFTIKPYRMVEQYQSLILERLIERDAEVSPYRDLIQTSTYLPSFLSATSYLWHQYFTDNQQSDELVSLRQQTQRMTHELSSLRRENEDIRIKLESGWAVLLMYFSPGMLIRHANDLMRLCISIMILKYLIGLSIDRP